MKRAFVGQNVVCAIWYRYSGEYFARNMYLGRRYLLCVLICTLAWKEFEAQNTAKSSEAAASTDESATASGGSTTSSGESTTPSGESTTPSGGSTTPTVEDTTSSGGPAVSGSDLDSNTINEAGSKNNDLKETPSTTLAPTDDKKAAALTPSTQTTTTEAAKSSTTEQSTTSTQKPTEPAPTESDFLENIKVILVMNSIILLIITLIIICVLIYYVFMFDSKKNYDEVCKEIDVQCCCDNNRGNSMSEC